MYTDGREGRDVCMYTGGEGRGRIQ